MPKPSRTPFNFFAAEARPRAKAAYPDVPQSDITKKVRKPRTSILIIIIEAFLGKAAQAPVLVDSNLNEPT